MKNEEFMYAILSNDKSGSNFSCFSNEELQDFINYFNSQLALGVKMSDDLLTAGGLAQAELDKRCIAEKK